MWEMLARGGGSGVYILHICELVDKRKSEVQILIWFLPFRHCIDLFLDFVTLFRKLMMILAMNEKVC